MSSYPENEWGRVNVSKVDCDNKYDLGELEQENVKEVTFKGKVFSITVVSLPGVSSQLYLYGVQILNADTSLVAPARSKKSTWWGVWNAYLQQCEEGAVEYYRELHQSNV